MVEKLEFVELCRCSSPMEIELYTATLREQDIPHRARRDAEGELTIEVEQGWLDTARAALARAEQVFFGAGQETPAAATDGSQAQPTAAGSGDREDEPADVAGLDFDGWRLFDRDGPPEPHELRPRPVWPARVLALVPGLGLGHLYAGRLQLFVYLVFASLLGVLFYAYTRSWASFALNAFAWLVDLTCAPMHVREHNRRAARLRARWGTSED